MPCVRNRLSPVAAVLGLLLAITATPAAAATETAAQAAGQARALLDRVTVLQGRTTVALHRYDTAMAGVTDAVSDGIRAEQHQQAGVVAAEAAQAKLDSRVRALYISGGRAAMLSALLSSPGLADLTSRVVTMQHLVTDGQGSVAVDAAAAGQARVLAATSRKRALASIGTAGDALSAAARLQVLVDEQGRLLASANAAVGRLTASEAAAAARRAAEAAAALRSTELAAVRIAATATRRIAPMAGTRGYLALYRSAALTCPGLSWAVLAAVGQVESGHGRNTGTSSAGALGPMQFMPATFAAYAVDGDHDGRTDISSPADAIFTAAHFLCVHGAGSGPAGVAAALLFYNHAGWYVDLVVALAARYEVNG